MTVTAKDLRFKISMLFDMLNKGEDITVTYRGEPKAKLVTIDSSFKKEEKSDAIFGMLKNEDSSVDEVVRGMRKGRKFAI